MINFLSVFRMERVRQKKDKIHNDIESDIPTAPTLEDFYYDPGIRDHQSSSDPLGALEQSTTEICDNMQDLSIQHQGNSIT